MVLIIENNFYLGSVLKDVLLQISDNTVLYRSAEDAIKDFDFLSNHSVRAIVTNHRLPGINGIDFIQYTKPKLNPKVCILIGSSKLEDIPDDVIYFAKPFVPGSLLKAIEARTTPAKPVSQHADE